MAPRKSDIKLFRQAARAAGLSEEQRHDYSGEFHAGHRWEDDGLPDFAWFVADMRMWKAEESRPQDSAESDV
jgi:hypothetical protein